jgi:hypothetical protein
MVLLVVAEAAALAATELLVALVALAFAFSSGNPCQQPTRFVNTISALLKELAVQSQSVKTQSLSLS